MKTLKWLSLPCARRAGSMVALSLLLGVGILTLRQRAAAQTPPVVSPRKATEPASEIAALRAEIEVLKGKLTDQSHVMKDVGYHFANLWFAGQSKNWPLAKFYLDETRAHLKWAVRVIPVRKTKAGDLDLRGILEAVDNTLLAEIDKAIQAADVSRFTNSYRLSLDGCYSCHKAAEKPYLRPQIPDHPEVRIINFDPQANWPQ